MLQGLPVLWWSDCRRAHKVGTILRISVFLQIKRLIGSNQETLGIAERLVAGSLAGAISQSTIYPMEVRT